MKRKRLTDQRVSFLYLCLIFLNALKEREREVIAFGH